MKSNFLIGQFASLIKTSNFGKHRLLPYMEVFVKEFAEALIDVIRSAIPVSCYANNRYQ